MLPPLTQHTSVCARSEKVFKVYRSKFGTVKGENNLEYESDVNGSEDEEQDASGED
jgi:hypothetical protein